MGSFIGYIYGLGVCVGFILEVLVKELRDLRKMFIEFGWVRCICYF